MNLSKRQEEGTEFVSSKKMIPRLTDSPASEQAPRIGRGRNKTKVLGELGRVTGFWLS